VGWSSNVAPCPVLGKEVCSGAGLYRWQSRRAEHESWADQRPILVYEQPQRLLITISQLSTVRCIMVDSCTTMALKLFGPHVSASVSTNAPRSPSEKQHMARCVSYLISASQEHTLRFHRITPLARTMTVQQVSVRELTLCNRRAKSV
jgi:hypothetical protein